MVGSIGSLYTQNGMVYIIFVNGMVYIIFVNRMVYIISVNGSESEISERKQYHILIPPKALKFLKFGEMRKKPKIVLRLCKLFQHLIITGVFAVSKSVPKSVKFEKNEGVHNCKLLARAGTHIFREPNAKKVEHKLNLKKMLWLVEQRLSE